MKKKGKTNHSKSSGRKAIHAAKTVQATGVEIQEEDIRLAFELFGPKDGKVTPASMRSTFLALSNKKLTGKELKTIFDEKECLSIQDVSSILKDNAMQMDPILEAFRILDPSNSGFLSTERLKKTFRNLGYGDLTDDELAVLVKTGDSDGDGKIGLEDFRMLGLDQGTTSVGTGTCTR
jgi:Ca2+-binding EF-hand superfamily protein